MSHQNLEGKEFETGLKESTEKPFRPLGYKENIEMELRDICNYVLSFLEKYLVPNTSQTESKVLYLKMKGDYYHYLAEFAAGDDRKWIVDRSQQAFQEAFEISKK
ncbi:hypothetical protein P7K49_038540 [Saguinus oedipus]|uniref:14-3-3 domain-containing protein n=1 Tax=Saguinus oedipus TaxID=9490 RepID=A0ABQ9TF02_SAGOE|nr:hypothetical protein P7K49_038540 [Saguinus oedipus]